MVVVFFYVFLSKLVNILNITYSLYNVYKEGIYV